MIAREALRSREVRRLMTVPGVNVICAATFLAAVGDVRRFRTAAALVGYLGLDPRVRQSGTVVAPHIYGFKSVKHLRAIELAAATRRPSGLVAED